MVINRITRAKTNIFKISFLNVDLKLSNYYVKYYGVTHFHAGGDVVHNAWQFYIPPGDWPLVCSITSLELWLLTHDCEEKFKYMFSRINELQLLNHNCDIVHRVLCLELLCVKFIAK